MYEQLLEKVEAASESTNRSRAYVYAISAEIETYLQGVRWSNTATISGLMKRSAKASDARIELIGQLERWEVSFSSADLFRWAFSSASDEIGRSFDEFFKVALSTLPSNSQSPSQYQSVSAENLRLVKERADVYLKKCDDFLCYLHDLVVEAQNELLSTLFDHRVIPRKPLDSNYKVISESNRVELLRYFREETNLGKSMEAARARVRENLRKTGTRVIF